MNRVLALRQEEIPLDRPGASPGLRLVPISFRQAEAFIDARHRHNKPPRGMKFAVGVEIEGVLVGVATCGRPIARALDNGRVLEINRTCTDGTRNVNSMLYGACRRAAVALGYERVISYTQGTETGVSLRAAGFRVDRALAPRGSWSESSVKLRNLRDAVGNGGVSRTRWVWP